MKFLKKTDALNYYNKCNDDSLRLFQEDINRSGSKHFYVAKPNDIFHRIKRDSISHFYEFWSDKTKLSFGLDIDMKVSNDFNYKPVITKIIENVIDGAKKYYNHIYKLNQIIVLQNDELIQKEENPDKISFHVIFKGLTYENHLNCKDFFTRLSKDYDMNHCDKAIYNLSCLRLCFNSKKGKEAILKPVEYIINGQSTLVFEEGSTEQDLKKFWIYTMVTNYDKKDKLIDKSYIKTSLSVLQPKYSESESGIDNINLENILFQLPCYYYDDYDKWSKIGMILNNISTDKNDYHDLWNRWSQQSEKYKESEMLNKWKSFATIESKRNIGIGTLIKWCKDEGIVNIYKNTKVNTENIIKEYPEDGIEVSDKYMNKAYIVNQTKLTPAIFKPYLKSKLLAVQSEKGTGKTYNLLEALFADKELINKNTSILFISSRRTFGIKLLNDLREHGFKLYSEITDPFITSKRIICQIDSLMRLERDKYDYVIVDECESLARYLTSSHFTKNIKASMIVSTLEMRVNDADHVYVMDADLSDRCLNYFSTITDTNIENMNIIINKFKPYSDYQIQYMSYVSWLNKIMSDIDENKKLVIPMASNNKAKDLLTKINQDFPEKKVLLIHKETSDEEKLTKLLKVNEQWITYDIVIYTPSVCMGVSFDVPNYFDNIYAYGCTNSLGSQEFCQMLHRVRSPKNNIIYISMDFYKQLDIDDTITYNIVEQMLCSDYYLTNYDLHNNLIPKKVKKIINASISNSLDDGIDFDSDSKNDVSNKEDVLIGSSSRDRVLVYPYKEEPIYDLYVRNSWESIEDKLNFSAKFFGYVKHKGYQLLFIPNDPQGMGTILQEMKSIRADREEEELSTSVVGIYEAPELTQDEYLNKIRQRDEYLDKKDIYSIKRHNMIKCYGLQHVLDDINAESHKNTESDTVELKSMKDLITKEFIEEFYDKLRMRWFRNLTTILNTDEQNTNDKLEILKENAQNDSIISNCYLDFTTKNKYSFHFYAIEILNSLGFDINNIEKTINHLELDAAMYGLMEWCETRKFDIANKFDVKVINKKLTDIEKLNDKLKFINNILSSQYGLKIRKIKNSTVDAEKILYRLSDDDIWENIKGIRPINLISKREEHEKYRQFDTSQLDLFIEDISE